MSTFTRFIEREGQAVDVVNFSEGTVDDYGDQRYSPATVSTKTIARRRRGGDIDPTGAGIVPSNVTEFKLKDAGSIEVYDGGTHRPTELIFQGQRYKVTTVDKGGIGEGIVPVEAERLDIS